MERFLQLLPEKNCYKSFRTQQTIVTIAKIPVNQSATFVRTYVRYYYYTYTYIILYSKILFC